MPDNSSPAGVWFDLSRRLRHNRLESPVAEHDEMLSDRAVVAHCPGSPNVVASGEGTPTDAGAAPFLARYRAVLWEPPSCTGECLVALVLIQTLDDAPKFFEPIAFNVLGDERLRQLLGQEEGARVAQEVDMCATQMSGRMRRGEPLGQIKPSRLFTGLSMGSAHTVYGGSAREVIDLAITGATAFRPPTTSEATPVHEALVDERAHALLTQLVNLGNDGCSLVDWERFLDEARAILASRSGATKC